MTARWSASLRLTAWAWFAAVLGCVPLGPLVDNKQFLVLGAITGALVAATGALCRLGNLPVAVIVPVQLVVLLEWLTFTFARSEAWAGLVPTGASVARLADFVRGALDTAQVSVPPAPVDTAVLACLTAIVALVVLAVDLVAVTWRRPALVGLLFLGIYMAPVSLLAGNVPVLAFVPAAVGYVLLLAAEQRDRLSHWGRQITYAGSLLAGRDASGPTVTSLVSAGRRVGFGAVALAVVLPVLVPTLPRTLLGDGPLGVDGDLSGGDGSGGVQVDNPMLDLKRNLDGQSDEVLLTFTTDDPQPGYLRLAALDTFTGDSWQPGARPADTSLALDETPVIPGLDSQVNRVRVGYDVEFTANLQSRWLPTVYPVTSITADGDWGLDSVQLDVLARDPDLKTPGLSFSFSSFQLAPSRQQLDTPAAVPDVLDQFTELPGDPPAEIADLAADVTADASTPIERALALQQWFREDGGFRYSLDRAPGDGMDTITEFLTGERIGYCEQFAASMALMARTLGIPARVAVGFLRPERLDGDTFAYRGEDMHAWPELYFEGLGWLRFEPTPAVQTGEAPSYDPTSGVGPTDSTRTPGQTAGAPNRGQQTPIAPQGGGSTAGGSNGGSTTTQTVTLLALALMALVALAGAPRLVRTAVRRQRWGRAADGAAEPAWRELRDGTVDLGLPFDDRATLRTAGGGIRRYLHGNQDAIDALNRLVVRLEQARFARAGGSSATAAEVALARTDVETVLAALAAGRNRRRLLRATWLPLSLLRRVHGETWAARRGRAVTAANGAVVQVEGTATR